MSGGLVDAVGFDLDGTLYTLNDGINDRIRQHACQTAAGILSRPYEWVRAEFERHFAETGSGRISLEQMGIDNGREIVQVALEEADIGPLLNRDGALAGMLGRLGERFNLYLITSSPRGSAESKLAHLGVNLDVFDPRIYGESPLSRRDGSAFRHVATTYGIALPRMMFVGDREKVDIFPAQSLGLKTAMVNGMSERADYNLGSIYELEGVLLGT
ncbi:MAG: HAD family hydrolase [archaeon]